MTRDDKAGGVGGVAARLASRRSPPEDAWRCLTGAHHGGRRPQAKGGGRGRAGPAGAAAVAGGRARPAGAAPAAPHQGAPARLLLRLRRALRLRHAVDGGAAGERADALPRLAVHAVRGVHGGAGGGAHRRARHRHFCGARPARAAPPRLPSAGRAPAHARAAPPHRGRLGLLLRRRPLPLHGRDSLAELGEILGLHINSLLGWYHCYAALHDSLHCFLHILPSNIPGTRLSVSSTTDWCHP